MAEGSTLPTMATADELVLVEEEDPELEPAGVIYKRKAAHH